jgi:hypothetical protein
MSRRARRRPGDADFQPLLPTRVPGVVRALARWAVLSSMAATPACAALDDRGEDGGGGGSRPSGPAFEPVECGENDWMPPVLQRVSLTRPIDYVGIYSQALDLEGLEANVLVERGNACSGAPAAGVCDSALQASRMITPNCRDSRDCPNFLLTTAADSVARSEDRSDLLTLLGNIDSRDKALTLAIFDGFAIRCPESGSRELAGTGTREQDGVIVLHTEWEECADGIFEQSLQVAADGEVTDLGKDAIGVSMCAVGRRPFGLCTLPLPQGAALGAFFATSAQLEAASIYAFERLARELSALDAPAELVAAAARSALDEVRHARAMTELARRWGAEPSAPRVARLPLREPFAIALDNAVEGCVRETYGALLAHHQALSARDPQVRAAMAAIAEDETRHALLSWQVASWLEPRLPVAARQLLAAARADAQAQLLREVDPGLSTSDARAIGWPPPHVERALIERLGDALRWA